MLGNGSCGGAPRGAGGGGGPDCQELKPVWGPRPPPPLGGAPRPRPPPPEFHPEGLHVCVGSSNFRPIAPRHHFHCIIYQVITVSEAVRYYLLVQTQVSTVPKIKYPLLSNYLDRTLSLLNTQDLSPTGNKMGFNCLTFCVFLKLRREEALLN